jgi:pantetheine-phosphate adenylyltransferase
MTLSIFPGSFDPPTNGHLDLIERALKMFDRVTVAVLVNASKKPLFSAEERVALLEAILPAERVEVQTFSGLLVDYARAQNARVIIRGLRAVSDFEYELQMAMMNRELAPDLETVFLTPRDVYSYLSSRLVKEVASLGGDISRLVPPTIKQALALKYQTKGTADASQ